MILRYWLLSILTLEWLGVTLAAVGNPDDEQPFLHHTFYVADEFDFIPRGLQATKTKRYEFSSKV
jgi:hypothetical protein